MRCTSAQEQYLIRLMREAFGKHYDFTVGCFYVAENKVHTLDKESASKLIQHLLDAKARGWTAWETTAEAKAKATSEEIRYAHTQKRIALIKELKAAGHKCNCSEQTLEVDVADLTKCPLHSRLETLCPKL